MLRFLRLKGFFILSFVLISLVGCNLYAGVNEDLLRAAQTIMGGNESEIAELISKGADVNAKDNDGKTALIHATGRGRRHIETVKVLLGRGADVNAKDNNGKTALMEAIFSCIHDAKTGKMLLEMLLDKGAKVNAKDNDGLTALIYAAMNGHAEIVKMLLDKGADVNAKDNNGKTALMIASAEGDAETVKLLREYGAR